MFAANSLALPDFGQSSLASLSIWSAPDCTHAVALRYGSTGVRFGVTLFGASRTIDDHAILMSCRFPARRTRTATLPSSRLPSRNSVAASGGVLRMK